MSTNTFKNDMLQYFGMDEHAKNVCTLIFAGDNYAESINTNENPDSIKKEAFFQLLLAKNYTDYKEGNNPMDIHHEFIDMIVRLAQFHREIDRPASSDVFVEELVKMFDEELNLFVSDDSNLNKIISYINAKSSEIKNQIKDTNDNTFKSKPELVLIISEMIDLLKKPFSKIAILVNKNDSTLVSSYEDSNKLGVYRILKDIVYKESILASYSSSQNKKIIKNIIVDILKNSFNMEFIKKIRPSTFTTMATTSVADQLVKHVYLGWDNLSLEATKFYSTHLSLRTLNSKNEWVIVYPNTAVLKEIYDKKMNFRVNLSRNLKNNNLLFSEMLPFLPLNVTGFAFTNKSNIIERVNLIEFSEIQRKSILKYIYDYVYRTGTLFELSDSVTGNNLVYNVKPYDQSNPALSQEFNLNFVKFQTNIILSRDLYYKDKKNIKTKPDLFDDLYIDMCTNVKYIRDDKGIFKLVDSTKVEYNEAKLNEDIQNQKCLGTNLNEHKGSCSDVVQCVLNGKPENIVRCLKDFNLSEIFNVASADIANTNPEIILRILESFGFEVKKESTGVYLPPSYIEWKSYKNKDLVKLVESNDKLRTYIQCIVQIVRSNPMLIEKNYNRFKMNKDFNDRRGLSIFNMPPPLTNCNLNQMSQVYFPIMNIPIGVLRGGCNNQAIFDNGNRMKNHFDMIFKRMESNGAQLIDNDKQRILTAIDKLIKLEQQLPRLMEDLEVFSKVKELENYHRKNTSYPIEDISLQDVQTKIHNKETVNGLLSSLQNKFTNGLNSYYNTFNNLYYVVQPPLLAHIGN
jgi:hypothetical protein